jgi:hypothetical protein
VLDGTSFLEISDDFLEVASVRYGQINADAHNSLTMPNCFFQSVILPEGIPAWHPETLLSSSVCIIVSIIRNICTHYSAFLIISDHNT